MPAYSQSGVSLTGAVLRVDRSCLRIAGNTSAGNASAGNAGRAAARTGGAAADGASAGSAGNASARQWLGADISASTTAA